MRETIRLRDNRRFSKFWSCRAAAVKLTFPVRAGLADAPIGCRTVGAWEVGLVLLVVFLNHDTGLLGGVEGEGIEGLGRDEGRDRTEGREGGETRRGGERETGR